MGRCGDRTGERGAVLIRRILRRGYVWTIHCVQFAPEAVPGTTNGRGGRKPDNPSRRRRSWRLRTLRVDSHTVGSAASSGECGPVTSAISIRKAASCRKMKAGVPAYAKAAYRINRPEDIGIGIARAAMSQKRGPTG